MLPLDLYARVRLFYHHCTRDRGCSAHPAFPAPSIEEGKLSCIPRAHRRREIAEVWTMIVNASRWGDPARPHPEETAERSSRRMNGTSRASWFETALARLLTMRVAFPLNSRRPGFRCANPARPHPEETAKRSSRRMNGTSGASWFETVRSASSP
jgi:hypothetical protein